MGVMRLLILIDYPSNGMVGFFVFGQVALVAKYGEHFECDRSFSPPLGLWLCIVKC